MVPARPPQSPAEAAPIGEQLAGRATEAWHPRAAGLQALRGDEALHRLLAAQRDSLAAVEPAVPALARAAEIAAGALGAGGRLGYAGAGSSGLMALADALELAGTFGIAPERVPVLFAGGPSALLHMTGAVEDDPALAACDVAGSALGAGDAAVCVSASGGTPYTLAVARALRARGVRVIGIANVPGSALAAAAEIAVVLDTGAEMVAGSTRMAAGTAQKVALNLLSTLVGMRLGHVHDGYMVNLVADNAKLRGRAAAIVAALAGVGPGAAERALEAAGGRVKAAVLVAAGATPAAADQDLEAGGGRLGPALERWMREAGKARD